MRTWPPESIVLVGPDLSPSCFSLATPIVRSIFFQDKSGCPQATNTNAKNSTSPFSSLASSANITCPNLLASTSAVDATFSTRSLYHWALSSLADYISKSFWLANSNDYSTSYGNANSPINPGFYSDLCPTTHLYNGIAAIAITALFICLFYWPGSDDRPLSIQSAIAARRRGV